MARARGVAYPGRHFGRWLEQAIRNKIAEGTGVDSAAAVSRWLGHTETTRLNRWVNGRGLPTPDDYPDLARLGRSVDKIHELVALDRMHALSLDDELDEEKVLKLAAAIAHLAGMSRDEVIRILSETDLEELERALGYS